jgi:hypothetical protein
MLLSIQEGGTWDGSEGPRQLAYGRDHQLGVD